MRVQAPVGQQGTLGPKIETFESVAVTNVGTKGGYVLWGGSVDVGVVTGAVSLTVLDAEGSEVDVAFF